MWWAVLPPVILLLHFWDPTVHSNILPSIALLPLSTKSGEILVKMHNLEELSETWESEFVWLWWVCVCGIQSTNKKKSVTAKWNKRSAAGWSIIYWAAQTLQQGTNEAENTKEHYSLQEGGKV